MNKTCIRSARHNDLRMPLLLSSLLLVGAAMCGLKAHAEDKPFLGAQKPLDGQQLQKNRGARDVKVANLNDVHGSVQNNAATDVVTGHNTITNGSFSNVSGFPLVVQNTGANVVIQSSTIVNIGLQP